MAECQIPFSYAPPTDGHLVNLLSGARFNTYLTAAGYGHEEAFQLYLYNARLSKALLFPLHVLEVVLRNAIDELLQQQYGKSWDQSVGFLQILTPESSAAFQKAQTRAIARGKSSTDDVIAHLTMDFWSNLFRSEYDRHLWQTGLHKIFPNALAKGGTRATLQPVLARLNKLRNRIAHHEPVFKESISTLYSQMIEVIEYRSYQAANWVRSHSTVHLAMRSKPKGKVIGPTVGERCDRAFVTVNVNDKLFPPPKTSQTCGALIVLAGTKVVGVLGSDEIAAYILDASKKAGGMVDLNEYSYSDVLTKVGVQQYAEIPSSTPLIALPDIFSRGVRFAVVLNPGGAVYGILAQAHRRY